MNRRERETYEAIGERAARKAARADAAKELRAGILAIASDVADRARAVDFVAYGLRYGCTRPMLTHLAKLAGGDEFSDAVDAAIEKRDHDTEDTGDEIRDVDHEPGEDPDDD